jgi:hypothetical protein
MEYCSSLINSLSLSLSVCLSLSVSLCLSVSLSLSLSLSLSHCPDSALSERAHKHTLCSQPEHTHTLSHTHTHTRLFAQGEAKKTHTHILGTLSHKHLLLQAQLGHSLSVPTSNRYFYISLIANKFRVDIPHEHLLLQEPWGGRLGDSSKSVWKRLAHTQTRHKHIRTHGAHIFLNPKH